MTSELRDAAPPLADDALLAPFREAEAPVLTTEEVRDAVSLDRRTTVEELRRLLHEGVLERKTVGDDAVWWLPGHTDTEGSTEPMPGASREREGGLPQRLETEIGSLDAPNERERAAIYAACYALFEEGPASPAALRSAVYPEQPAGYDDEREWWTGCVRPALTDVSGVVRDGSEWRVD